MRSGYVQLSSDERKIIGVPGVEIYIESTANEKLKIFTCLAEIHFQSLADNVLDQHLKQPGGFKKAFLVPGSMYGIFSFAIIQPSMGR